MKTSTNKNTKTNKTAPKKATTVSNLKSTKSTSETKTSTTPKKSNIDPKVRHQMIAEQAYIIAEKRGFAPGNETQDWIQAEAIVDSKLKGHSIQ